MLSRDIKHDSKGSPLDIQFKFNSPYIQIDEGEMISRICEIVGFYMFISSDDLCLKLNISTDDLSAFFSNSIETTAWLNRAHQIQYYIFDEKLGSENRPLLITLFDLLKGYFLTGYVEMSNIENNDIPKKTMYFKLGQGGYTLLAQKRRFYNELQLAPSRKHLEKIVSFNHFMILNGLDFSEKIKQPLSHNFFICENNQVYYFKDDEISETIILRELQDMLRTEDGSALDHKKLREKFKFNQIDIELMCLKEARTLVYSSK